MNDTTVRVSEVFGPTIQGEGPMVGQRCCFIRLGGCDLDCSWCDTPYTWDWKGKNGVRYDPKVELRTELIGDVIDEVAALDPRSKPRRNPGGLVITGGEPLIQSKAVALLAHEAIEMLGWWCQIETNGRHRLPPGLHENTRVVVSPKLANSGVPAERALRPEILDDLAMWGADFKFVASTLADVDEAEQVLAGMTYRPRAWVMPEGAEPEQVRASLATIADYAVGMGFNLSPRFHVETWGNQRGV